VATTKADIYGFLQARGTPSRLPGQWEEQECDPSFFDLLKEPAELLTQLGKKFSPAALAKAGITGRDSDGAMTLSGFGPTRKYIAALRRGPNQKPFDLMTGERGSVAGHWAWHAAMDDFQVVAQLKEFARQLLIAGSAEDIVVLRSSGLPVAPAYGLASFRGDLLSQFCKVLELRAPEANMPGTAAPHGPHKVPFAMILVNWSPARLDLTDVPQILAVRDFLRNVKRHFQLRMDDFTVWKPSAANLERIRFSVEYGTKSEIWEAMLHSLGKNCHTLDESLAGKPRWPTSYAEAVTAWTAAAESSSDGGRKKISWQLVQKLHHADVVEPLLKVEDERNNPLERAEMITLAEVLRVLHLRLLQCGGGLDRSNSAASLSAGSSPDGGLKETLALLDRARGLATSGRTWQGRRRLKPARPAKLEPRSPSSAR
jgi:hypothetical protein